MAKDFHIADARTLLEVLRTGSITAAARALGSTASQVSKAVKRMERVLGAKPRQAPEATNALLAELESLVAQADRLASRTSDDCVAAFPTELSAMGVKTLLAAEPALRWQMLDWNELGARMSSCDVAVSFSRDNYPAIFDVTPLGTITLGAFAAPTRRDDANLNVVATNTPLTDLLGPPARPLVVAQRVSSFAAALAAAANTELVAIGPVAEARAHLAQGSLVTIDCGDWPAPRHVDLLCHAERVSARLRRSLIEAFRDALSL
jgi:DNA-binding transcriptional LysR family regulator